MKVAELWADFGHRFPGISKDKALPSIETLFEAVDTAAADFNQKRLGARGKFVDGFQNIVGTLNDHSYLFSIIPDNDKTLTEAFTSELSEIREELFDVPKICDVGNPAQMMPRVVKLYTRIFEFLFEAMCWYQSKSKRFKAYLNENYYTRHFQPLTANIRKAIASIRHGAELITQQKVGYIVDRIDRNQNLRIAGDDVRYEAPIALEAKSQLLLEGFKKIGKDSTETLCAVGEQFLYAETGDGNWISRTDLRRQADLVLAKFTDDGREELKNILRGSASPMIPQEVSIRIQSWIQNKTSQLLWVDGPVMTDSGSGLSLTALRIYEVTMQAEIPCVSFFCKRKYDFMSADSTTSEATLMALLCTVMDQLINLLPPTFESTHRLNLEIFDTSAPEAHTVALDVIEQLLSHAPPTVTFVIDGLELVTKATEISHLIRFVELLRTVGGGERAFKVLLTTNGNSRALGKSIHWKERVDGSRFAQGRPGQLLRGATHLSEIG
ncbi:hypothetical protein PG997_011515 [Apiospora hydei]|uniref:Uncharacterized protein n=1 Tax=Apiospora hydei TaxID=1337664 RepID=A0ABR1VJA1_9PEZI